MKHFVFFQLLLLVAFRLRGEAVCDQNSRGTALIVIDMQPGFVTRGGNHEDSKNKQKVESIIGEQTKLIERARSANLPIIFLEYEGNYGETSSTLKQAVEGYSDVKIF